MKHTEIVALSKSYSFLHSQRLGALFDRCHKALWTALEGRNETPSLLRLFRHSSFVWRIRGDEKKESTYLDRLNTIAPKTESENNSNLILEFQYFWKRVKVLIISAAEEHDLNE